MDHVPFLSVESFNLTVQNKWHFWGVFSLQIFGEQLLKECLDMVARLLSDNVYAARREGGCLVTTLYRKWTRPQVNLSAMQFSFLLQLSN